MKHTINGSTLPNIIWEEKPEGCNEIIWRSKSNPIIPRNLLPGGNSIFNSAVVPFEGGYAGVFRCDDKTLTARLHKGFSKDGLHWNIDPTPIKFTYDNELIGKFEYGYDPRVCWIEDRYYITWCNGYYGPTIGMGYTYDFNEFFQMENAFLPYNRNGVLFPRRIHGRYAMLSRPSDDRHTDFGDIFYSESQDMIYWGRHRHVMSPAGGWQCTKVGGGPVPIETGEGWLILYHGVITTCNGFIYRAGAALLDIDQPWKVKYRTAPYILSPQMLYECVGDVPNVVFPVATLLDAPTGRMTIYYGAADTCTCLAYCYVDELIDFIKSNSL